MNNFNMASAGTMTAPYGAADHIMPEELRMREAQSTGGQQSGMAYADAGTAHAANGHSGQLWSAMNSTQSGLLPQQPHFADGGGSMLGRASAAYVGPRVSSAPLPELPNPHLYGVVQDEATAAAATMRPAAAAAGLAASGGGNGSSPHPHARQFHQFQNGGLFGPPPVQPHAQAYAFPRDWLAPGSPALPAAGLPHSQPLHQWQPALEHLDAQMSRPQRPRRHMGSQYAAASPDLCSLAAAIAHPLAADPSPQLPTPPLQPPLQIKEAARRGRPPGQGSGGGGGRGGRGRGAGRRGANRDEDEGDWKPPPTQRKAASQAAGAPSLRERSGLAPPRRLSQLRQHEDGDGQQAGFVLPAAVGGSAMQLGAQTADYAGGSAAQLGALAAGYTAPAGTAAAAAAAAPRPPPQAQHSPSPKRQRPASAPAAPTGGSAWQVAPPPAEAAAPPAEPASTRTGCAPPEPPAVPADSEPAPAAEPAAPAAPAPVAAAPAAPAPITEPPAAAVAAPAAAATAPAADATALATAGASKPAVESAAAPPAIAAAAAAPSDAAPTAKAPAAKTPAANPPEAESKDGDGVDSKAVVAAAAQAKVIWGRVKGFPFWPVGTFFLFCNVC